MCVAYFLDCFQQQLYDEVDEQLPPAEETEYDGQRVQRGQPPSVGQVQRDRDGYISPVTATSRAANSNIIPSSLTSRSSGKVGGFSFGTQVDQQRAIEASQNYR